MPLVTLTTDIGIYDYIPGAIKGRLMQCNDQFTIIDILHSLPPFNFPQAAYICKNILNNYPAETLHIVLSNVFDEPPKQMLFAAYKDQFIGCADNGLLAMILEDEPAKVIGLPLPISESISIFDCTTAIGNAFNALLSGKKLEDIGVNDVVYNIKNTIRPKLGQDWMEGQIIFIDNFENVIINITKSAFEEQRAGRGFKIVFKRDEVIDRISGSYADVPHGEKLALFNSAGYLEIAINKGNAAGLLGLQGYTENSAASAQIINNKLIYQMVKIYFDE